MRMVVREKGGGGRGQGGGRTPVKGIQNGLISCKIKPRVMGKEESFLKHKQGTSKKL